MKRFIFTIMCLCITILMTSCVSTLRVVMHVLNPSVYPLVMNKKAKMERNFYMVVYGNRFRFDEIEELLKAGVDPNRCIGDAGWYDGNPLFVMVSAPPPPPPPPPLTLERNDEVERQIQVLRLLHEYGADIHRRPYIWYKVNKFGNEYVESQLKFFEYSRMAREIVNDYRPRSVRVQELADQLEMEDSERENKFKQYIDSSNKVIKALLEMGADPDQKGHPFPFTREAINKLMNDKKATKYFAQGTRAINEAIEKGMRWESQVDLLLQYTSLDEESLNAAQRSNDPKMIEKIDALWKKQ